MAGGGFREWLARQEALEQARELAAEADELQEATKSKSGEHRLGDHLATLLTIRCAKLLTDWKGEASREFKSQLRVLRGMAHDIASLARVSVERQRLELMREKSQAELVDLFSAWMELPAVREAVCDNQISPEERRRIIADIYGRAVPEETEEASATTDDPPEGSRSTETATGSGTAAKGNPIGEPLWSDPLKSKTGRKRWLKDPTACDGTGRKPLPTGEERRRAIREIYGLPEEGKPNVGLAPNVGAATGGDAGAGSGVVQGPNQTQSESIKPTEVEPATSKTGRTAEEDRRWRIAHHFETEEQSAGENQPPEVK